MCSCWAANVNHRVKGTKVGEDAEKGAQEHTGEDVK